MNVRLSTNFFCVGKFKEAEKENDYHNNLMGNYGLSQIITAIFICACCIVLMAAQEISVADILQVPSSLGLYQGRFWYQILAMLISILLIALTFRINVNYGKRMLMTEKTDLKQQSTFLVQSSYLTTSIQSLTSPSSASAIATASKQQQYKDPYSWFRPNLYAFLILWIGCGSVILTSYLIPASTNTLFYTVAVPIAEIHALFIGLDAIYLNSALLSMAIFMVATFSASSSNLLTGLDANSAISLAQYIVLISLLIFMTLINNFRFERISRLNFYLKRQNQVSFEQLKLTQHATESLLSNILPVTLVDKLKDSPSLQIAEDKPSLGIIFFSICNIDRLSEKSVIWLLNDIICDIDECCLLYGIEKIKTIGARYIACVEPCEDYDQDYLTRLISFSLELQNILNDFNERTEQSFTFRTGISGECVKIAITFR